MRLKSNIIKITYDGAVLLEPGMHIDGSQYGFSRSFTTSADDVLDAVSPEIRAFGNAHGEMPMAIAVDFDNEESAFSESLDRVAFMEDHQTGILEITIGKKKYAWHSGISNVSTSLSYMPESVRLIVNYTFTLGASANLLEN
jgi:hypothetical protein